jgi:TolB-like protein
MVKKEKTPLRLHAKHDPIPSPEEVRQQLKRILENLEFQATGRQREFLQFVVTETIAGRVEEIKGYTVATQVFGRKEDFDQSIDPVVSIQANKLRRALERYYLVAGKNDPVRIDIPKGTYVPTFQMQPPEEPGAVSGMAEREVQAGMGGWPSVLVRPFKNLTGDVEQDFLVEGLSTELAIEMTRYQDIMVLMNRTPGAGKFDPEPVAQFLVEGSVRMDQEIIKVAVYLIEMKTGRQIWGDMYDCDLDAAQLIAFQEEVAQVVAANISGEHGMISKTLSIESKNKAPSDLSTYEAILAYHQYDMAVTADTFFRAMEALKGAADIEPECGQVWSMLGRLYADNYSLEYFDIKTPIDKAVAFAEKGISLNPANQRARAVLAYVRLLSDEIPAARIEAERALALNPNSLLFMDNIGYLLALSI